MADGVDALISALQCGRRGCQCQKWRGTGNVHCPVKAAHAHGDADPGLNVTVSTDAKYDPRVTMHCGRGCSQQDVLQELRAMALWPPPKEEREAVTPDAQRPKRMVAEWPYKSAAGVGIAWKQRYEFTDERGGKTFLWRREGSQRPLGLQGISIESMPPYNLEGVLESDVSEPVYIAEGEKAADALIDHGIVAVSFGGGAAQQRFGDLSFLKDRDVILWPDNDPPGFALMTVLATALPRARFLRLPEWLAEKGDAFDFFADERGTVELIDTLGVERVVFDSITPLALLSEGDERRRFLLKLDAASHPGGATQTCHHACATVACQHLETIGLPQCGHFGTLHLHGRPYPLPLHLASFRAYASSVPSPARLQGSIPDP